MMMMNVELDDVCKRWIKTKDVLIL